MTAGTGSQTYAALAAPPRLGDAVHVWHGRLPMGLRGVPASRLALLSAQERARYALAKDPAAGARYAAVRLAVRELLHTYLGVDPARIRFAPSPCCRCGSHRHGRPRIIWPSTTLQINVSHSGPYWLMALAAGRPVGVDVECHRAIEVSRLAPACLTSPERAYVADAEEPGRTAAFLRCWTRKEAVLKGCGVGLAADLAALDVRPHSSPVAHVIQNTCGCASDWLVQDLNCGADRTAALAQPAGSAGQAVVRLFSLTPDASGPAG
ncbi:4'-phosphopantetheinyl transferase family protein [Streptomyces sp. NPDC096013]|uniref:4'-phosphopantetheinyl transferase family protein n=1 Tax=Streptomyces sp. NPDC096013 TaxID=3366069 RepID=UPI0038044D9F